MKYSYGPTSLIQRVEVVRTETGAKRAYLESAPGADAAKLAEVRESLAKHGYLTVPIEMGGKPLLEIRKFTNAESLLKQLGETGATSGVPSQQMVVQDRIGAWQWIKNNTYKACLSMYAIGDIGYIFYGKLKEPFDGQKTGLENKRRQHYGMDPQKEPKDNPFDKYAGWAYLTGTMASVASTALRGDQSDEEVYAISEKIRDKLGDEGSDKTSVTFKAVENDKNPDLLKRIKIAFVKHPAEILNVCYGVAGLFISIASRKHLGEARTRLGGAEESLAKALQTNNAAAIETYTKDIASAKSSIGIHKHDIALGSITLTSGVLSSVIREKPKSPDEPEPQGAIAKAWRWLQEKPLRIAGGGYMISTLIHIHSTAMDYKRIGGDRASAALMVKDSNADVASLGAEKNILAGKERGFTHGRMIFCITNVIAEILMMLSSKGHGEGVKSDATVETSATAIAAENIALQAPEKREELIEKFAQHLASPKVMGGSSVLIARGIRSNLASLAANPWADTAAVKATVAANDPVYHKETVKPAAEFAQRITDQAAAANDAQYSVPAVG